MFHVIENVIQFCVEIVGFTYMNVHNILWKLVNKFEINEMNKKI
jgi:hypothetical protein